MTQVALSKKIAFKNTYLIPAEVFKAVRQRVVGERGIQDGVTVKSLEMRGAAVFEGHDKHLFFIAMAAMFVSTPENNNGSAKNRAKVLQEMLNGHLKTKDTMEDHQLAVVLGFAALCEAEYPQQDTAKEKILKLLLKAYTLYKATPPADDTAFMRQSVSSMTEGSSASASSEGAFSDTRTSNGTRTPRREEEPVGDAQDSASPSKGTPAPNRKFQNRDFMRDTDNDGDRKESVVRQLNLSADADSDSTSFSTSTALKDPSQTSAIPLIKRLFGASISSQPFFDAMPIDDEAQAKPNAASPTKDRYEGATALLKAIAELSTKSEPVNQLTSLGLNPDYLW